MPSSEKQVECSRYRENYMCPFQMEGPRVPCDKCPNNLENLRRRIEALEEASRA